MNIRNNIVLRQKLAAEYVLGTLRGGARRRFEAWLVDDPELHQIVGQWQQRLTPMAEFAGAVTPPNSVWNGIERRLKLRPSGQAWKFWLNDNLAFWRSLGMVSTALAALLVVVLVTRQPSETGPAISYVAALTDDKAQTIMLVTADQRQHALDARVVAAQDIPSDKSLHLWAVPTSGHPRSLGVLPDNRHGRFKLTGEAISADVALLAISLEPKGGSPNPDGPTGPILWKGGWVRL